MEIFKSAFGTVFAEVLDEHQWNIEEQTRPTEERPIVICNQPTISAYFTPEGTIVQLVEGGIITRRTIVRPKYNRIDIEGLGRTMSKYGSTMSGFAAFKCMMDRMGEVEVVPPTIVRYAAPECDEMTPRAEFVISGGMKTFKHRTVQIRKFAMTDGKMQEMSCITVPIDENLRDVTGEYKYKK